MKKLTPAQLLKALKEEKLAAKSSSITNDKISVFDSYLFNLSNDVQVDKSLLYKKVSNSHTYEFEKPNIQIEKQVNYFEELHYLIPAIIDKEIVVDPDFLTGIYIAKKFLQPLRFQTNKIITYHTGITSDQLLKGISHSVNMPWMYYGTDLKYAPLPHYIGGSPTNNVYDLNSVRNIKITLQQKIQHLDACVLDVACKTAKEMLLGIILAYELTSYEGINIQRIPLDWSAEYTKIVNLLLFIISYYQIVYLFKTPWGTPKLYLIYTKLKVKKLPPITVLTRYAEALDNANLYRAETFADLQLYANIQTANQFVTYVTEKYPEIVNYAKYTNCQDANEAFIITL